MTPRQMLMVWSLRALVLWGGAELGLAGYDEVTRERDALAELDGHAAAMARLDRRASEIERATAPIEQELAARRKASAVLTLEATDSPAFGLSEVLRDDLMKLGAQAPQVTADLTPIGNGVQRANVRAQWIEPTPSAPALLAALAFKRPYLTVQRLVIDRPEEGGALRTAAELQLTVRVDKGAGR